MALIPTFTAVLGGTITTAEFLTRSRGDVTSCEQRKIICRETLYCTLIVQSELFSSAVRVKINNFLRWLMPRTGKHFHIWWMKILWFHTSFFLIYETGHPLTVKFIIALLHISLLLASASNYALPRPLMDRDEITAANTSSLSSVWGFFLKKCYCNTTVSHNICKNHKTVLKNIAKWRKIPQHGI